MASLARKSAFVFVVIVSKYAKLCVRTLSTVNIPVQKTKITINTSISVKAFFLISLDKKVNSCCIL